MSEFKAKEGYDLSYYSNIYYGSVDYVYKLASDNNISVDADITGLILYYDETFKSETPNELVPSPTYESVTTEYVTHDQQNIYDLALQLYGSVEYVYKVVGGASMNGMNDKVSRKITFDPNVFSDGLLKRNIKRKSITFATGTINDRVKVIGTKELKAIKTIDGKLLLVI